MKESTIEKAARYAHEINRAYCQSLGDDSQPSWDDAPQWHKDSCMTGATAVLEGEVSEPGESHAGWLAVKEKEGWVYGEEKDVDAKTHPCMVPFEELPAEQQTKDHLFLAAVKLAVSG